MTTVAKMMAAAAFSMVLLQGCSGKYHFTQVPDETKVIRDFAIEITPVDSSINDAYSAFNLNFTNNTNSAVKIDWNKTYFLDNNETRGRFMLAGTRFRDRNKPRPLETVEAHETFSELIYPVDYAVHYDHGWTNSGFGTGKRGILLTVLMNNREINQTVVLDIERGEEKTAEEETEAEQ